MKKVKYKIINRISQSIQLIGGEIIVEKSFIIKDDLTEQIKNLSNRGFVSIRCL